MYQQDPHADRQQNKFLMEKIHELQSDVDRLIRHQNGNYLASTENFCFAYIGFDMGSSYLQKQDTVNRGWAFLMEPRGTYAEKHTGLGTVEFTHPGTRIHFFNRLQRPLFEGELWAFLKDRLGNWNPVFPMSTNGNGPGDVNFFREPNVIGKCSGVSAAEESEDGTITVGSGLMRQMYFDHNTETLEFEEGDSQAAIAFVTVYNTTANPIEAGKIIHAKLISNKYFVDVEPCDEF